MLRIWRRDETILYLDDTERVTRRAILCLLYTSDAADE